jgi:hypothetical protein
MRMLAMVRDGLTRCDDLFKQQLKLQRNARCLKV